MTRRRRPVVAIDGPAGAGKSTVARRLAARLGYVLIDTGALYRALALAARECGTSWDDGAALGRLAHALALDLVPGEEGLPRLFVDGHERSADIRTPEISRGASAVSRHPDVRDALLGTQRALGAHGGAVVEGRDIGTVVFPDAEVKIFLTASPEVRAERRVRELRARGTEAGYEETLAAIRARDAQDGGREVAPLKAAEDAVEVDTTELDAREALDRIEALVRRFADGV